MDIDTRVFFEAAHRLTDYSGKCKRIHGHNWVVDIGVSADRSLDKVGFVVDFGVIKDVVNQFDHMLILKDCKENRDIAVGIPSDWIVWTPFNPTCEEFARFIVQEIASVTGLDKVDISVTVHETYKPEAMSSATSSGI